MNQQNKQSQDNSNQDNSSIEPTQSINPVFTQDLLQFLYKVMGRIRTHVPLDSFGNPDTSWTPNWSPRDFYDSFCVVDYGVVGIYFYVFVNNAWGYIVLTKV